MNLPQLFLGSLLLLLVNTPQADEVENVCRKIGSKLGSVSIRDCLDLQLSDSGGRSVNNTSILIKEYPPLSRRQPEGRVLLIGGIHGDEYSSVSIVFKWLKTLDKYHSGLFHWKVVPLMNPDGLLQAESKRFNANGVDLNRNFPISGHSISPMEHWIQKTERNARRYPGKTPLSEPETQWLVEEIKRFQPDVLVSVHAPHGIVDYDGPKKAPNKLGRLHLNLLGTYPGSLGRYAGIDLGLPVVTIELPYAGIMPKQNEISDIWTDLVQYLKGNVKQHENVVMQD